MKKVFPILVLLLIVAIATGNIGLVVPLVVALVIWHKLRKAMGEAQ